jgi:hypothetical protein
MCKLCDESEEMQSCPDCGKLICFDCNGGDDIIRPAYVTESADLYCDRCGREHDAAEDEEMDPEEFDDEERYVEEEDKFDTYDGTEGGG